MQQILLRAAHWFVGCLKILSYRFFSAFAESYRFLLSRPPPPAPNRSNRHFRLLHHHYQKPAQKKIRKVKKLPKSQKSQEAQDLRNPKPPNPVPSPLSSHSTLLSTHLPPPPLPTPPPSFSAHPIHPTIHPSPQPPISQNSEQYIPPSDLLRVRCGIMVAE